MKTTPELDRLRDELRLQAHLAAMDVRDAWKKLGDRAAAVRATAIEDLAEQLEKLRKAIERRGA